MEAPSNTNPLENIALAFSGGGFRAANYSLGVLSYLNNIKLQDNNETELEQRRDEKQSTLLSKVSYISSASGGTIINASYALSSKKGVKFEDYFSRIKKELEGRTLLEKVMEILNKDQEWEHYSDKRRNMINAFALAYNENIFDKAKLGDLVNDTDDQPTHLQEVCFNSTEFYRGLLFRQQVKLQIDRSDKDDFNFGNSFINLQHDCAKRLKISDIMAASSCFPAGFEPMIFPNDFTYNDVAENATTEVANLTKSDLLKSLKIKLEEVSRSELGRLYKDPATINLRKAKQLNENDLSEEYPIKEDFNFGIMDGGITDNQALESMLKAQCRRSESKTDFKPFTLMLINDVDSPFMDPYQLPKDDEEKKSILDHVNVQNTMYALTSILGVASLLLYNETISGSASIKTHLSISFLSIVSFVSASGLLMLFALRKYVQGNIGKIGGLNLESNFSKKIVEELFNQFKTTPASVILRMVKERVTSILTLNNEVFLKRIRYLLYNNADESQKYEGRLQTNHIYDLSFSNDLARTDRAHPFVPSTELQQVAQKAFKMGTTLWFSPENQDENMQAALIACGQFTTCYNLYNYLESTKSFSEDDLKKGELTPTQQQIKLMKDQLRANFDQFNADPFWLYNQSTNEEITLSSYSKEKILNEFSRLLEGQPKETVA